MHQPNCGSRALWHLPTVRTGHQAIDYSDDLVPKKACGASEERDLDDFKEAFIKYHKATPNATYAQLETTFHSQDFSVYLIAIKKGLQPTYTNIDL